MYDFEVKPVKKVTVTEQIMEQIAELITSGQIRAGDKLPNERDLAERFQVTRGRVREALRALSLVGLITIKAGEGSYVNRQESPISSDTITWLFHNEIHNLDEIYMARKLIESEIYITAAANATNEHINQLIGMITRLKNAENSSDPEQFLQLLDQFDLYMGQISDNRIYNKLMQTIVHLRRETSLKLLSVPGAIAKSIETRSIILEALKTRDTAAVKQAIDNFFSSSRQFYNNIMKNQNGRSN